MQVERSTQVDSGERVSNALVTCLKERDNRSKDLLIPHVFSVVREPKRKAERRFERDLRPIS
jgi:hypothetical protein